MNLDVSDIIDICQRLNKEVPMFVIHPENCSNKNLTPVTSPEKNYTPPGENS